MKLCVVEKSMHKSLTWDNSWINKYESIWSIYEKLKIANNISNSQLNNLLINNLGSSINSMTILYLDFNEKTEDLIGYNLKEHQYNLFRFLFGGISTQFLPTCGLFNEQVTICSKCLTLGYHSIFHQLRFIKKCPFHNCDLTITNNKDPLICDKSLYNLFFNELNPKIHDHRSLDFFIRIKEKWLISAQEIQINSEDLKEYINFNFKNLNNKRNIYLKLNISNEKEFPDYYSLLLSRELNIKQLTLPSFRKSPNLQNSDKKFSFNEEDFNDLYISTYKTFKSIVRYLESRFVKKHKYCIYHIQSNHPDAPKCSISYSYLYWRKFEEDLKCLADVNKKKNHFIEKKYFFTVYSPLHRTFLDDIFYNLITKLENEYKTQKIVYWLVNSIYAKLVLNHFYGWLNLYTLEEEFNKTYYRNPITYVNKQKVIIDIDYDRENPLILFLED